MDAITSPNLVAQIGYLVVSSTLKSTFEKLWFCGDPNRHW